MARCLGPDLARIERGLVERLAQSIRDLILRIADLFGPCLELPKVELKLDHFGDIALRSGGNYFYRHLSRAAQTLGSDQIRCFEACAARLLLSEAGVRGPLILS